MNGKGSLPARNNFSEQFRDNWETINWNSNMDKLKLKEIKLEIEESLQSSGGPYCASYDCDATPTEAEKLFKLRNTLIAILAKINKLLD